MSWIDYMVMAASHSKGNAEHWFRYLSKFVEKRGVLFSDTEIEKLCRNEALTPFQRVSIKAAFTEGSATWRHINSLNQPRKTDIIERLKARIEEAK